MLEANHRACSAGMKAGSWARGLRLPALALIFAVAAGLAANAPAVAGELCPSFSHAPASLEGAPPAFPTAAPPAPFFPTYCPDSLTQSTSQEITYGNSVSCNAGGIHTDNSYWRVFDSLAPLRVVSVSFGVEQAITPGAVGQPVTVRLYSNGGSAFPTGSLTQLAETTVTIADQTLSIVTVPIRADVPFKTPLVVEVFTPDGTAAQNNFFIGSNALGESGTSYIRAAACGIATPVPVSTIGFPNMHIVMNLNLDNCAPAWSTVGAVGALSNPAIAAVAGPVLQIKGGVRLPASLTARYGVPDLKLEGKNVIWRFRYRDNGTSARVRLALMRADVTTGAQQTVATFDSNSVGASAGFQLAEKTLPLESLQTGAYWVQAILEKKGIRGTPALHSMDILWTDVP